jgi:ParB-like nuclease domain
VDNRAQAPICSYRSAARLLKRVAFPPKIRQIADSIAAFGFLVPILIDESGLVIAGHGRYAAVRLLGRPISASNPKTLSPLPDERIALLPLRCVHRAPRSRQLQHGCVLAFAHPGEQHGLPVGELQRIVMHARLAGRKVGREAAKKNGREAYEEASYRAYERAYERVLESLKNARRQDHP